MATLHWITNLLHTHNIPFQISGGLAARTYGASRPLNDIDIDISEEHMQTLVDDVRPYITFGPERFKDEDWDLLLLTLNYEGQSIDLCGIETAKIFDKELDAWVPISSDLPKAMICNVLGIDVPVMHPQTLIDYKRRLNRIVDGVPIDLQDAAAVHVFLDRMK